MSDDVPRHRASGRPRLARVVSSHEGPPAPLARLPMVIAPSSKAAASFRLLQYRLRHQGRARIVAVTSPKWREGKTTCAVNLSMALAEQGEDKVLLVEANLQRPAIAQLLNFVPPSCFAQQVRSGDRRSVDEWHAVSAFFPNLHVLAVDPAVSEPQLLDRTALLAAIEQLGRSEYASIVLDCPPTLGSADMSIVADCVDGIFLTSLAGRTRRSNLRHSVDVLAPIPILGTVVMGER